MLSVGCNISCNFFLLHKFNYEQKKLKPCSVKIKSEFSDYVLL